MTAPGRVLINGRPVGSGELAVQENQPLVIRVEPADPAHLVAIRLSIGGQGQGEGSIPQSRPGGVEWRFTAWSAAGLLPVEVGGPSGAQRFYLKVEPAKLTAEEYESLLADLRRVAYGIIYTIYAPTHRGLQSHPPAADPVQRLLEQFAFLEEAEVVDQVLRLVGMLPVQQVMVPATAPTLRERVRRVSLAGLYAVARQPDRQRVPAVWRELSPDCYENRVVKLLLCSLRRLCQVLAREAQNWLTARGEGAPVSAATLERVRQVRDRCQEWTRMLDAGLRQEPWPDVAEAGDVGRPSTVFVMQPVYRELLRWYQRLQERWEAAVEAPSLTLPLRSLPELYEYWCFAKVVEALQRRLGQPGYDHGLVHFRPGGFEFGLRKEGRSRIDFAPDGARRVSAYYNKRYVGFTGLNYYPDVSIEVEAGDGLTRLILLDAKYRVDEGRGYKQEDVDKMHAYRDALTRDGVRVEAAFILYPGAVLLDPPDGPVGAIPLRPGLPGDALDRMLARWLA